MTRSQYLNVQSSRPDDRLPVVIRSKGSTSTSFVGWNSILSDLGLASEISFKVHLGILHSDFNDKFHLGHCFGGVGTDGGYRSGGMRLNEATKVQGKASHLLSTLIFPVCYREEGDPCPPAGVAYNDHERSAVRQMGN